MLERKTLRIARPTDRLDEVVAFYLGLGFTKIGQFEDHAGFDGVMVGMPMAPYHLEFTHHRGHKVGRAPTQDNLLVFYVPSADEWKELISRMRSLGYHPVASYNPYWDRQGVTFEDPDGYRVVLQNSNWDSKG